MHEHHFQYPTVREIPQVREPITPDCFAVFPERRPLAPVREIKTDTLTELGRRVLNELRVGNGQRLH